MIDDFISLFLSKNLVPKTPPRRPRYKSDHQHYLKTAPQLILEEQNSNMDKSLTKISKSDLKKINIKIPKQNRQIPLNHQPRSAQMSNILSPQISRFNNYQSQQPYKRKFSKFELLHSSVKIPCSQLKEELVSQLESQLLLLKKIHQDRLEENEKLKLEVYKKECLKSMQIDQKLEKKYQEMEKLYIQQKLNIRKQELGLSRLQMIKEEYQKLKQRRVELVDKNQKVKNQIDEVKQQQDKFELDKEIMSNKVQQIQVDIRDNRKLLDNDYILKIMGLQFQIENKINKVIQQQNDIKKSRQEKIRKIKQLKNKMNYEEQLFYHQMSEIQKKKEKYQS